MRGAGGEGWARAAASRVEARFAAARRRGLRARPVWATARTSYAPRPLPAAFRVEVVDAGGVPRRVARGPGRGPPVLILPGLYADLDEGLFSALAEALYRAGRAVVLLEDRFAAGTLRLDGAPLPTLADLGREAGEVAARLGEPPDVLALSAGAAAALALPPARVGGVAAFSAAVDPRATLRHLRRRPLFAWYFGRAHRRAFREAGRPVPPLEDVVAALAGGGAPGPPRPDALLLVHAADDPVAPAAAVEALRLGPGQRRLILPRGGHLGFGSVVDDGLYLTPFAGPGR